MDRMVLDNPQLAAEVRTFMHSFDSGVFVGKSAANSLNESDPPEPHPPL